MQQKSQKLGHIDFAKLYAAMPGQDSIRKQYEEYSMQLQGQFQAMQTEYENKADRLPEQSGYNVEHY